MAGTLFGIPLSQPVDVNGNPLAGNLLYVYESGTSIPASTFQDFGLTPALILPFPITADASGRIPQFWVADGTYRARLTTFDGILVYDEDGIQAIGPSTGTGGGSGGGIDATSVFQTGDPLWLPFDGTRSGWIRLNNRTFGSASSGAVERANADTQALYEYCWNNFTDALCPVTGGRGANGTADFNANKPMKSLDMRGAGAFGLDTMGNSAAGRIAAATTAAALMGTESTTDLPAHTHTAGTLVVSSHTHSFSDSFTTSSDGAHTHSYTSPNSDHVTQIAGGQATSGPGVGSSTGSAGSHTHTGSVSGTTGATVPTLSGATASTGSGPLSLLNPMRVGTWFMKL